MAEQLALQSIDKGEKLAGMNESPLYFFASLPAELIIRFLSKKCWCLKPEFQAGL